MGKAKTRLEQTAYHEAGHAVVDFFLGCLQGGSWNVRMVTIVPKGDFLGCVLNRPYSKTHCENVVCAKSGLPSRDFRKIVDRITVRYAGMYAEKRFTGRVNHIGATHDRSEALDDGLRVTQDGEDTTETRFFLRWLKRRAENHVAWRWPYIVLLAEELLKKKTMTGKEVREFLRSDEVLRKATGRN